MSALEAIDILLSEELPLREHSRMKTAPDGLVANDDPAIDKGRCSHPLRRFSRNRSLRRVRDSTMPVVTLCKSIIGQMHVTQP
ncbi:MULTISPECIES: hypothetical protein [unclassified Mesorhizobium]|uniref:hypothetical protein n=1 Tax=unclassified Mesorhizobium TaxID=325217 RepID=UPI002980D9EA|nr:MULTISPECIES: hypothetical protein [unclassified Mesorhizobium]